MIRGLYSAAGALQMAERNHEVVAHNLANANMPGFRRQVVAFESFAQTLASASTSRASQDVIGSPASRTATEFEPGELLFSGHSLDLALKGDGFFVVEGPNGSLYTRNGVFEPNGQGELQTAGGLPVTGTGGRITIPPGTAQITVREDGTVVADNADVGRLKLAQFKDTGSLVPAGTTLFEAPAGVRPDDAQATVHQGYRESSNVQVVDEMVRMIAGMRHYETSQRAIKALSDAIEQTTRGQAG
jgi:flagellar basal body rod protein FlgG